MLKVHVNIRGDKETIARLNKVGDQLSDWTSTLVKVSDLLQRIFEVRNFSTKGGYIGTPWAPLKPSTVKYKAIHFRGKGILQATETMQHAWDKTITPRKISFFNTTDYAHWHQTGTSRMPSRALIDVNQRVKDDIIEVFKIDLSQKLTQAMK